MSRPKHALPAALPKIVAVPPERQPLSGGMNQLGKDIAALMLQCLHAWRKALPKGGWRCNLSERTTADYLHLADALTLRARYTENGLVDVLADTQSPGTFYKRLAAMRYHLHVEFLRLLNLTEEPLSLTQLGDLAGKLSKLLEHLQELIAVQAQGLEAAPRRKRNSKRRALAGLPWDWRELMCERGSGGKYAIALLVTALTGCRPAELESGIRVWRTFDWDSNVDFVQFSIAGAKVTNRQGQPTRTIAYSSTDSHPLVTMLFDRLHTEDDEVVEVRIAKAINLTLEVRRLAKSLWPSHKQSVTAYCFRHQWSADVKLAGNGDAVSQGLGHASARTRRSYGTAQQANRWGALRPVAIDADRSVRPCATPPGFLQSRGPRSDR